MKNGTLLALRGILFIAILFVIIAKFIDIPIEKTEKIYNSFFIILSVSAIVEQLNYIGDKIGEKK